MDDHWEVLHLHHGSEVLAIHAALLGDGRVLYFSGSEHNAAQHNAGEIDHSRIFDPTNNTVGVIPSPTHDLFCAGHAFLGDGRLVVAGGTLTYDYLGLKETTVFDASALARHQNPWTPVHDMGAGRWYPTLVTLPDGRVMVASGTIDTPPLPAPVNAQIELFEPEPHPGVWIHVSDQAEIPGGYPRMHLLPNGLVLCVTPMAGVCRVWNPVTTMWADLAAGPGDQYLDPSSTSVLLPLRAEEGYRARVMVAGRAQPMILDTAAPETGWAPTAARALHGAPTRNFACAVLLPDATVLVCGGSTTNLDADGVLDAELFDPATGAWSAGAAAEVPRVYHNTALLLPDGRVWTAGSNHDSGQGHSEHRVEAYSPAYLARGPRPEIAAGPTVVRIPTGFPTLQTFQVATSQAASITSAALLRCGSITHAFDGDQRYVGLTIVSRTDTGVVLAAPPTTEVAPPGPYFLFVLNQAGVPSVGWPVRIEPITWTPVKGVPGWFGDFTADGDVAVGDVSGSGRPDLVVLHVDAPDGENHGYYRIGRDLDVGGNATGGWSTVKPIPGWFGGETQGAGLALGDISGTGRPDLVVFHVDAPEGENYGYYRIGWDLNPDGDPQGGWTAPKPVPGWFGGDTEGAGVAVADISGDGRPDLVVFHIDAPPGDNHGYYRIGWSLDAVGNVSGGWTDPIPVPGWFGGMSAGAGVAVADFSGSGRPDLVVLHVDAPEGGNHGAYRIGWDLDMTGKVTGGWTEPAGVPGWFGQETQGAGVAVSDLAASGRPGLVVFHVDAPDGGNGGYYRLLIR